MKRKAATKIFGALFIIGSSVYALSILALSVPFTGKLIVSTFSACAMGITLKIIDRNDKS